MLNRWVETDGLLDTVEQEGIGTIVFSPLAQGLLSDRYLGGIPKDSRAAEGRFFKPGMLTEDNLRKVRGLNDIAARRGQTLAQMAIAWVLRGGRVTSALIGASRPEQIEDCVAATKNLDFSDDELREIDTFAAEGHVNLWTKSAELKS